MVEHYQKTCMIHLMQSYEYQGGCHCGDVRYKITLSHPLEKSEILLCNCSMCEKFAYLHLIVAKEHFSLITDPKHLHNYQFNKKIAKHYFCKNCGVKSFYQPRSHPNAWSINVRCIDDFSQYQLNIKDFDGKNWEQNIDNIR